MKMAGLELAGKRVLIREDLNVPIKGGVVTSDARIRAALPTIQAALAARAHVLVMSHLGRPEEGDGRGRILTGARCQAVVAAAGRSGGAQA